MSEDAAGAGFRTRGEEALGDLAQALLENPLFNQALTAAMGAGERAAQAQRTAMGALNIPAASELERLEQRLRSLSNRLESVEDRLDDLSDELAVLRRRLAPPRVPDRGGTSGEKGVAEALRAAIEGTLSEAGKRARAGSSALRPERATQLLDEVARQGKGRGTSCSAGTGCARPARSPKPGGPRGGGRAARGARAEAGPPRGRASDKA